ncbi:unnamed protein product, partial [Polarella glacialis]
PSGLFPDDVACNVALASCAGVRNWRATLALMQGGRRSRETLAESREENGWPDVVAYNTALGACAQDESWPQALQLLGLLVQAGLKPEVASFNAALEACREGKAWRAALQGLAAMEVLLLPAGTVGTNLAAAACQRAGRHEEAWRLLTAAAGSSLQEASPDVVTFKTALSLAETGPGNAAALAVRPLAGLRACARQQLELARQQPDRAAVELQESGDANHHQQQHRQQQQQIQQQQHQQESGDANALGAGATAVVAMEALQWHGPVDSVLQGALWRCVGAPVVAVLQAMCSRLSVLPSRTEGRLTDPVLERQFGLSADLTVDGFHALGLAHGKQGLPWRTWAACGSRRPLASGGSGTFFAEEPTSKDLTAWASWLTSATRCRARAQGHGTISASEGSSQSLCAADASAPGSRQLLPVQVQHDRAPHAERQLLVAMLQSIPN